MAKRFMAMLLVMLAALSLSAKAWEGEPFNETLQWNHEVILYAEPSLSADIITIYPRYTIMYFADRQLSKNDGWEQMKLWDAEREDVVIGWVYRPATNGRRPPLKQEGYGPPVFRFALVTADEAPLRMGPHESAPVLGYAASGHAFFVGYLTDEQCFVSTHPYNDGKLTQHIEAWIDLRYVKIDAPYVEVHTDTNAYAWPHTNAPKLKALKKGDALPMIDERRNCYVVLLDGGAAFVHKNLADVVRSPQWDKINPEKESRFPWSSLYGKYGLRENAIESTNYQSLEARTVQISRACDALAFGSADGQLLAELEPGESFTIIGEYEEYYIIRLNGGSAFIEKSAMSAGD